MDALDRRLVDDIAARFQALTELVPLSAIKTERDCDTAVSMLNKLLDAGAADECSPLAFLANLLGSLIGDYEDSHDLVPKGGPLATLRFLMEQHGLTQSDLPEVGSQGVVSETLRGLRELNVRQIKALAARFHVPATVFM